MNLSLTRKIKLFIINHPSLLESYQEAYGRWPKLPKGYRHIMKK